MDPLTQGALGAALPQATRRARHIRAAAALGFLSGMVADLDILIRSDSDPLLFLDFHRQFTHSLIFMPVGGLLCALVLHAVFARRFALPFAKTALFCTLGYATHAFLDVATTYGTMLLWPFSETRFALNIVSVIDPLVTVPFLALLCVGWLRRSPVYARFAIAWIAVYFCLGAYQHNKAEDAAYALAHARGHTPTHIEIKPSFANIVLWKSVYEADGVFYIDAVRQFGQAHVIEGEAIPKLVPARDLPWLAPDSQQARDLVRFTDFSDGYVALSPNDPTQVIDIRYSFVPNKVAALWSIQLDPTANTETHVRYRTDRRDARMRLGELWSMLIGIGV